VLELAPEASAVRILPRAVNHLERKIIVRCPGHKPKDGKAGLVWDCRQLELGSFGSVDQIREKDVKLVSLDDLGRRVIAVVVCLVVLVPFETCVHTVEEPRLARLVLVSPQMKPRVLDLDLLIERELVRGHAFALLRLDKRVA